MPVPRAELVQMLDELEAVLPDLIAENSPGGEFHWPAFEREAAIIRESAAADDAAYAGERLARMLSARGLDPRESPGA